MLNVFVDIFAQSPVDYARGLFVCYRLVFGLQWGDVAVRRKHVATLHMGTCAPCVPQYT